MQLKRIQGVWGKRVDASVQFHQFNHQFSQFIQFNWAIFGLNDCAMEQKDGDCGGSRSAGPELEAASLSCLHSIGREAVRQLDFHTTIAPQLKTVALSIIDKDSVIEPCKCCVLSPLSEEVVENLTTDARLHTHTAHSLARSWMSS